MILRRRKTKHPLAKDAKLRETKYQKKESHFESQLEVAF
jgi:hypothetical protein